MHDQPVPARPGQPVHPGRDVGGDLAELGTAHPGLPFRCCGRPCGRREMRPRGARQSRGRNLDVTGRAGRAVSGAGGVSLTRRTTTRSYGVAWRPRRNCVAAASAAVDVPQPSGSGTWSRRRPCRARWWPGSWPAPARRRRSRPPATWSSKGLLVVAGPPRRGHPRPAAGDRHPRRLPAAARAARRRRPDLRRRGVGQAVRGRAGAAGRRREGRAGERPRHLRGGPRGRHHGDPRHGGPHHHRLDAAASCASCGRTSRRPAPCCRPTCTAPRPTAATWPTPARGCGCARAPTRSRSRWPSRASATSTARTSGR